MVYLRVCTALVAPIPAEDAAIAATDGPAADIAPVGVPASESVVSETADSTGGVESKPAPVETIARHDKPLSSDAFNASLASSEGAFQSVELKSYTSQPSVTPLWSHLLDAFGGESNEWEAYTGGTDPETLISPDGAFVIAGSGALTGDRAHRISKDGNALVATGQIHDGLKVVKRFETGNDPHVLDAVVQSENHSEGTIRDLWVGMADAADGEDANPCQRDPTLRVHRRRH